MASWPSAATRRGHPVLPPAVHRRVAQALRADLRRALRPGAALVGAAVLVDAAYLRLRFGSAAGPAIMQEATIIALALCVAALTPRFRARPELPALVVLALLYGVSLVNLRFVPAAATSTTAYLAIILIVSALFLSWSPRWHAAWVGIAIGMSAVHVGIDLSLAGGDGAAVSHMMAAGVAGLASLVGHRMAYWRLRRMLEQQFQLRILERRARIQEREVDELNRELMRSSRLDSVTGIGNRAALDDALAALRGQRFAVVLLDVDHFKAYNDRNGHLAGDEALARVGSILRDSTRGRDLVFRYGGEEFLILLPGADREGATRMAERVRRAIEEGTASDMGLTVSAGVAVADRFSAGSPLALLRRADGCLYQAKRTGRNRVVVDDLAAVEPMALHH